MTDKYKRVRPPGKRSEPAGEQNEIQAQGLRKISPPGASAESSPENQKQKIYNDVNQGRPENLKANLSEKPQFAHERKESETEGKKFPCDQCGGAMELNPQRGILSCRFCGAEKQIQVQAQVLDQLVFDQYAAHTHVPHEVANKRVANSRCDGCGAEVSLPAHITFDFCPFCHTQIANMLQTSAPMLAPIGILPFQVEKKQALANFHEWIKKLKFIPPELKDIVRHDVLEGIYLPYWVYETRVTTYYRAQKAYGEGVSKGKIGRAANTLETILDLASGPDLLDILVGDAGDSGPEIYWVDKRGELNLFFNDVAVCASDRLPLEICEHVQPSDLSQLRAFDISMLSGFKAERYQMNAIDGLNRGKQIIGAEMYRRVEKDIGGEMVRIEEVNTEYGPVTFKHVLLPLWFVEFEFKHKRYHVYVNAQTGEVFGDAPITWFGDKFQKLKMFWGRTT